MLSRCGLTQIVDLGGPPLPGLARVQLGVGLTRRVRQYAQIDARVDIPLIKDTQPLVIGV